MTKKSKNIIVPILILLVLIVWGRNIYLIFIGVSEDDDTWLDRSIQESAWIDTTRYKVNQPDFIYQSKYRDPFRHWLYQSGESETAISIKKMKPKVKEPKQPPPRLRFSGILQDASGMMAIIEGSNAQVYYVNERDEIEGVKILHISNQAIQCVFEKEKYELQLSP